MNEGLMEKVRAQCPNPKTVWEDDSYESYELEHVNGAYCVAGALRVSGLVPEMRFNFPTSGYVTLMLAPLGIDCREVQQLAKRLTRANDSGEFEEAWQLLDSILRLGTRELTLPEEKHESP